MIPSSPSELGKNDAEEFIRNERIDYKPFIAISDLHLVRKTFPISFGSLEGTITKLDDELWPSVKQAALLAAEKTETDFDFDAYAEGFAEGVAAVWEKIREDVLSDK